MRKRLILILFTIYSIFSFGQDLKPFALMGQTEPEQRKLLEQDGQGGFYAVVKVKGHESSKSIYELVHYDENKDVLTKKGFTLSIEDNVSHVKLGEENFFIFITRHNLDNKRTTLFQKTFSLDLRSQKLDTLLDVKIEDWVSSAAKGAIDQTFDYAIRARQSRNFVTPLEYRFYFEESNDGKYLLIYYYTHSQSTTQTKLYMYTNKMQSHKDGIVGIDRGYVNHGFKVNNLGELFIVKSSRSGKVAIIKYNMDDRTHKYVYLPPTNSLRTDVKVNFINDNKLLVTTLNKKNGSFLGYTFSHFDFDNEKVSRQHSNSLDGKLKAQILHSEEETNLEENEGFKHYELLSVDIDSLGNVYTLVERRELEINAHVYDSEATDVLKEQVPKMGQVVTSTVILTKVDYYFKPIWTTFFSKYQSSDLTHGLNNASLMSSISNNGDRTLFYATSRKGVFLNSLNVLTVSSDGIYGSPRVLDNEENLTPVLPYCYFNDSSLILVGKKGLLGKKTYITNYLINDE